MRDRQRELLSTQRRSGWWRCCGVAAVRVVTWHRSLERPTPHTSPTSRAVAATRSARTVSRFCVHSFVSRNTPERRDNSLLFAHTSTTDSSFKVTNIASCCANMAYACCLAGGGSSRCRLLHSWTRHRAARTESRCSERRPSRALYRMHSSSLRLCPVVRAVLCGDACFLVSSDARDLLQLDRRNERAAAREPPSTIATAVFCAASTQVR